MRSYTIILLSCGLLAGGALGRGLPAQGRPLTVTGSQILDFGNLFPGVRTTVLRTDAARSGRFDLAGRRLAEIRVDFTLPGALVAPSGRTVPLQFAAGDGGFALQNSIATATSFDPRVQVVTRLSGNGRLFFWLGGTALPSPTQQAATYNATVTLTAAYTGNE